MLRLSVIKNVLFFTFLFLIVSSTISAHCDAENGPVAVDARTALSTGNFDAVAIWVGEDQEKELSKSFEQAVAVYNMNGKAGELAEDYFIETAILLHREAEGMPYTGVKEARQLPTDIEKAEKALETGDLKPLTDFLTSELVSETEKWFGEAIEAKVNYKGESIEAGREWVDAYVKYVIYTHGLYMKIKAGPAHGVGE